MTRTVQSELEAIALGDRVRRYVAQQLSAEDCTAFEIELIGSPELQDLVEAELTLREHRHALAELVQPTGPVRAPGWQLAAAVLVALGAGFGAGRLSDRGGSDDQTLGFVSLTRSRGAEASISVPTGQPVVARVLTAIDQPYDAVLLDADGSEIRRWHQLKPAADGYITFLLPALANKAARYRVDVLGDASPQQFQLTTGN